MYYTFNDDNFHELCNKLAKQDAELKQIIRAHGHPPLWSREPGFETLIHIILEQQVSLASAKAALHKLKEKIDIITPERVLDLTDAELKSCYFSRQKTIYARELAQAIVSKELDLKKLNKQDDEHIRKALTAIKGIGNWTVDVYLLMGLQRTDIFPIGDLAMVNSLKKVKQLPHPVTKEQLLALAESWKPYRSIASMILWHHYIQERNIKL